MGFAVWVPANAGFTDVEKYLQIYTPGAKPSENPGRADSAGRKSVLWRFKDMLVKELAGAHGTVVVMAIPCLADNIAASTDTAAYAGYDITRDRAPAPVAPLRGFDDAQLARIACGANT